MGDSYRAELTKKKTRSGFQVAGYAQEADREKAEKRAAIRKQYTRKPPVRHHQATQGTLNL